MEYDTMPEHETSTSPSISDYSTRRFSGEIPLDEVMTDAAMRAIGHRGWDSLRIEHLAQETGLAVETFKKRFASRDELGLALWSGPVGRNLMTDLSGIGLDVADNEEALAARLLEFARATDERSCSLEMVLASFFDSTLESIREETSACVNSAIERSRESGGSARAAATGAALGLALGLMLVSKRPWATDLDLTLGIRHYAHALTRPGLDSQIPMVRAEFLHLSTIQSGDARLDAVLAAAAWEVGDRGFTMATIPRICRRAGVSEDFVYGQFPEKFELVRTLTEAQLPVGFDALATFIRDIANRHGRDVAEAVAWREIMDPNLSTKRSFAVEINRLASNDESVREVLIAGERRVLNDYVTAARAEKAEATARFHIDLALGFGFYLLPNLVPSVASLPFIAVTPGILAEPQR